MKNLTFEEAHKLHVELWDWLAKNIGREKWAWPKWKSIEAKYGDFEDYSYCFCCYIADSNCNKCPIKWRFGKHDDRTSNPCCNGTAEFIRWNYPSTPQSEMKYATIIKNKKWTDRRSKRGKP